MPWEACIALSFYQSMNCITDDVTGTCSIATDPVPVQTLIGPGTPKIYLSIPGCQCTKWCTNLPFCKGLICNLNFFEAQLTFKAVKYSFMLGCNPLTPTPPNVLTFTFDTVYFSKYVTQSVSMAASIIAQLLSCVTYAKINQCSMRPR